MRLASTPPPRRNGAVQTASFVGPCRSRSIRLLAPCRQRRRVARARRRALEMLRNRMDQPTLLTVIIPGNDDEVARAWNATICSCYKGHSTYWC